KSTKRNKVVRKSFVIGMICVEDMMRNVMVVSEHGFGKRSEIEEYRITNRGGKGVKTINITEKTGELIAIKDVTDEDDLMIMNRSGLTIRLAVNTLRVMGRATQGVKLIELRKNDVIAAVARVEHQEEVEQTPNDGTEIGENKEDNSNSEVQSKEE
ncbi:MAG: DNA gyrase subunit A, partial [Bacteroidales bacterium]|nr:DNA gyrase subunit A [Bacteroidales bacterium]